MAGDNDGKRIKLQEESTALTTSLIKSKSCLNKPADNPEYLDEPNLEVSSPLLSDHLLSVQQEVNKWISLHINETQQP